MTGYDALEGYAIAKNGKMYYAFFTPDNWKGELDLRGLEPGKYKVSDYAEGKDLGTIDATGNGVAELTAELDSVLASEEHIRNLNFHIYASLCVSASSAESLLALQDQWRILPTSQVLRLVHQEWLRS